MKLYKYVSSSLWECLLKKRLIRFTQPSALNDPFEMKPFYERFVDEKALKKTLNETSQLEYDRRVVEQYEKLPDEVRAVLPINSIPTMNEAFSLFFSLVGETLESCIPMAKEKFSENINKHIGVLCLSEAWDNQLMWSHYADSHKGFVIEFNPQHSYFNQQRSPVDEFGYLRQVKYAERPSVALTNLESLDVFFVKGMDWEREKEWRMLRPLKDHTEILDESIYLFSFPPECITGVILGSQMLPQIKQDIQHFLEGESEYSHVVIYHAVLDERRYKLRIVPANEI